MAPGLIKIRSRQWNKKQQ